MNSQQEEFDYLTSVAHDLADALTQEDYDKYAEDIHSDFSELTHFCKVFAVALIDYFGNYNGLDQPDWVYDESLKLPDKWNSSTGDYLATDREFLESIAEPEFLSRNILTCGRFILPDGRDPMAKKKGQKPVQFNW